MFDFFRAVAQAAQNIVVVFSQARHTGAYFQSCLIQGDGQKHRLNFSAIVQGERGQAASCLQVRVVQQFVGRCDGRVGQ